MRLALVAVAALSLTTIPLSGQTPARRAEGPKRPPESCGTERVEPVIVVGPNNARNPVLDAVAAEVNYWFRPGPAPAVRSTSYAVTVTRDGALIHAREFTGDVEFDRAARQAVDAAAHEHAFDRLAPDSGSGPVGVTVHFGQDPSGGQLRFVKRAICDAYPYPDNPRPNFPLELQPLPPSVASQLVSQTKQVSSGEVVARFLVDSTGLVDSRSFTVVSSTDPLFAREVKAVLPQLRFFPAELAGRRAPQMIEQRFHFRVH